MNASLTNAEVEALLEVLHRGLIQIRLAGYAGDVARAEAIADALHNVPRLIIRRRPMGLVDRRCSGRSFSTDLTKRYPTPLQASRNRLTDATGKVSNERPRLPHEGPSTGSRFPCSSTTARRSSSTTCPSTADGLVDCWEMVDFDLFREKIRSGWVLPHADDGAQIRTCTASARGRSRTASGSANATASSITCGRSCASSIREWRTFTTVTVARPRRSGR